MSEETMDLRTEVAKAMLDDLEKTPANGGEHGCLFDVAPDFNMNIRGHVDLRALADAAIAVATKSSAAYIERLEAALKPFADAANKMEKVQDGRPLWDALQSGWSQRNDIPLTVLNLRDARAALQTGGARRG